MTVLEVADYCRFVGTLIVLGAHDDQYIATILFRGIYLIEFEDIIVALADELYRVLCVELDVCISKHQDLQEP
jgi:hypothetical protein